MSNEKARLDGIMRAIKNIFKSQDVAGTIILSTPKIDGKADDFVTIKYDHLDTSFSYAKTFTQQCCNEHGKVDGVMIHAEISKEANIDAAVKKLHSTVGMFNALWKGANKTKTMCEEVVAGIASVLAIEYRKRGRNEEAEAFKKSSMN